MSRLAAVLALAAWAATAHAASTAELISLKNITEQAKDTALAKANQTANSLLALNPFDIKEQLYGGAQSAAWSGTAAARLAEAYAVGARVPGYDLKNSSQRIAFEQYTAGRLAFENTLRGGSAYVQLASTPSSMSIATNDIVCYVDPSLGVVTNVRQGVNTSCTAGGYQVTIPSSGKFMTKVELAVDKEVAFVGRMAFHLRDTLDGKPKVYTCGWAGGDLVSLFPPGNVVWRIDIGCMPVTPAAMGRRRRLQQFQNGTRYAVNPELVNPLIVSSAVVASTSTAGSPPLSAGTDPTGVVKSPPVVVPAIPGITGALAAVDSQPPACADGSCVTPFTTSPPLAAGIGTPVSSISNGIVVPFSLPSYVGQPPVTNYLVSCLPYVNSTVPACSSTGAGVITQSVPATASPLQATFTNLTAADQYVCYVIASNGVGAPVCSAPSSPVTVLAAPTPPIMVSAVSPGVSTLNVYFNASTYLGYGAITNFTVKCEDEDEINPPTCGATGDDVYIATVAVGGPDPLMVQFTGLPGDTFVCFAIAQGDVGGPQCSAPSNPEIVDGPPGPPVMQSAASATANSVTVSFGPTQNLGVPPIQNYTVSCVDTTVTAATCTSTAGTGIYTTVVPINASPLQGTVSGIPTGHQSVCFVIANNLHPPGDICSAASNVVTVNGPPSAPVITDIQGPNVGLLDLTFSPSSFLGVPPLTSYTSKCIATSAFPSPTCADTGAGVYTQTLPAGPNPLVANYTGLPGGQYYCFAIANNGYGGDQCSAISSPVLVDGPPTPPTMIGATSPALAQVVVDFGPSAVLGYPPITNYTVSCVDLAVIPSPTCTAAAASGVYLASVPLNASPLQAVYNGLPQVHSFKCWVIANNGHSPGDVCSSPSGVVVSSGPPNSPSINTPTSSGAGQLTATFTPSTVLGSPQITATTIKCINTGITSATCGATGPGVYSNDVAIGSPSTTSFTLLPGGSYQCFAISSNTYGTACSPVSSPVAINGPPSAPTVGTATSTAAGSVTLGFTASAVLGTPPISQYTVKCVNLAVIPSPTCASTGAGVATTTVPYNASPLQGTVTGFPSNVNVTCYAVANNGVAPGDICSAASNIVATQGQPSAPTVGTPVSTGTGLLTVPFTAPTNLGNPALTQYTVKCLDSTASPQSCTATGTGVITTTVAASASPLQGTWSGLAQDTVYTCYVLAANTYGTTCSSVSSSVTIKGPPSQPRNPVATSTLQGTATLTWAAPTTLGTPAATTYTVLCADNTVVNPSCTSTGPGVFSVNASVPALSATVSGLTGGTVYTCFVGIANAVSVSPSCSTAATVTVLTAPPTAPTVTSLDATQSSCQMAVNAAASSFPGNPAVTSYTLRCVPANGTTQGCASASTGTVSQVVTAAPTMTYTFTSLYCDVQYTCFAIATNLNATVCSTGVQAYTNPAPVAPGTPTNVANSLYQTTSTSVTLSYTDGVPLGFPWPTYTYKCVARGAGCNAPAIGTPGVFQVTNRNGTSGLGTSTAMVGCEYQDCYVVVSNNLGTSCSLVAPDIVTVKTSNFDTFNLGSINGQQGWTATETAVDQGIVLDGANKVFRISNAYVQAVGFVNMPRAPLVPAWVGEPGSYSWGNTAATNQSANASTICFALEVRTSNGTVQDGLSVDLSIFNQVNDVRMSRITLSTQNVYPNVLQMHTDNKLTSSNVTDAPFANNFPACVTAPYPPCRYDNPINDDLFANATLPVNAYQRVFAKLQFQPGYLNIPTYFPPSNPSPPGYPVPLFNPLYAANGIGINYVTGNDQLYYYINNNATALNFTSETQGAQYYPTTWEGYYAVPAPYAPAGAATPVPRKVAVDTLIFRPSGGNVTGVRNAGFYFKNVGLGYAP